MDLREPCFGGLGSLEQFAPSHASAGFREFGSCELPQELSWRCLAVSDGQLFAKFCQDHYACGMSTMNISLPETLKSFVDEQVESRGFGTSSEYVRELIRKDQERLHLRELLLAGARAKPAAAADGAYFAAVRANIDKRTVARKS